MKKKHLLVILVLIFQLICSSFVYVQASDDSSSSICAGPSETMSLYFGFQNEMKSVLLGSSVNERRFKVNMGSGGLFSEGVLKLGYTPLDLVSISVGNGMKSLVSSSATTAVLLSLSTISVLQSNTEGLGILFRDRPIVRDYKTMLDIESELFDIAYFRSKQINLTRSVDGDLADQFKTVVNKYKDLGLLSGTAELKEVSMSNVIWDLVWMNAAMKHFIVYDAGGLNGFHGCMNKSKDGNCVAVIEFSDEAVKKLKADYKGVRPWKSCNTSFKSLIISNMTSYSDIGESGQDVEDAIERLRNAFSEGWNRPWKRSRGCDISDYQMAQINAYRGSDWTCGEAIKLYPNIPNVKSKKSEQAMRLQQGVPAKEKETSNDTVKGEYTTTNKKQKRYEFYWSGSMYNVDYSLSMDSDFLGIYDTIKTDYSQSNWNAKAGDLSYELGQIKGLIDQIYQAIDWSNSLKHELQKIANFQCSA